MPATRGAVIDGRYLLEEPIGEGGAATVWRATHVVLDKPVAVKVHKSQVATEEEWDRYLREARVAAAVRHPNVVDILDFGTLDDGHAYIALEYLEGQTLARAFEEGAVTPSAMLRLTAYALDGLTAVHAAGIVHRDLKPENIFLLRDLDDYVYPKILDFGVSRVALGTSGLQSTIPTLEGYIVGTPHYMSPEQARGISGVDARSDVYSMGVILFEGLSGCLPYTADTPGDLLVRIIATEPLSIRTLRPDLDPTIHEIVERAMAKDPDRRYPSARAMRDAVLAAIERGDDAPAMRRPAWLAPEVDGIDIEIEGETVVGEAGHYDVWAQWDRRKSSPLPPPPSVPPRSPRRALWLTGAFASALVVGTSLGTGFVFSTSRADPSPVKAPAAPVAVTLEDVPPDAVVRVDGVETSTPLAFARSRRSHRIEVSADGFAPWRVSHPATVDGVYRVELVRNPSAPVVSAPAPSEPAPAAREAEPSPSGGDPGSRVRARAAARGSGGAITESVPAFFDSPGF
jgi:serine/threonine-protein kinase